MAEVNYGYSSNGVYPFRYIIQRKKVVHRSSNLNRGYSNKGISKATQRKIACAVRVLCHNAEEKSVRNSKGYYEVVKCQFITLTLPSGQKDDDSVITKIVLGGFLDRCRQLGFLSNYVWRAEKQKNGNIHYHIVTDSIVSYSLLYRIWLVSLERFSYVHRYTKRFLQMDFSEYKKLPFNRDLPFQAVSERYAKGVRNFWKKPPCLHVENISDSKTLEFYIAKYASKADDESSGNSVTGRVWACSSSVSCAVKIFKNDSSFCKHWYMVASQVLQRKVFDFDYFSMVKCSFSSISAWFPDVRKYIIGLMSAVFVPCRYHHRLMGSLF